MTQAEIDALFAANIAELNQLSIAAGSMVKTCLQALESNGPVYLQLSNPEVGGHRIKYVLLEGNEQILAAVVAALGLTRNSNLLEVPHA